MIDGFLPGHPGNLIALADSINLDVLDQFYNYSVENNLQWPNLVYLDHFENGKAIEYC